eukprot:s1102_g5.t2
MVVELTGSKSKIVYLPLPGDDPKQRRPNIRRAKELLDWEPKVQLREGLQKTIEYFKERQSASVRAFRWGRSLGSLAAAPCSGAHEVQVKTSFSATRRIRFGEEPTSPCVFGGAVFVCFFAFAAKAVIAPKPTKLAEGSLRAGETCFDTIADWKDVQGDSCQSYHDNQYCDRANGVFFGTKTAMMLYHAGPDSAAQVCCYCGGGVIKECDEMCRLLKKHEASEIESKFDAMRDAAGDAVTEAGAASMASMVKQMNASMEDALERLHAHSSKMLKEDLAAEESSFERMAASSVLSPKAATAETASIASKAAEAQMLKSLKHLDAAASGHRFKPLVTQSYSFGPRTMGILEDLWAWGA